jgi:PPOX class probable F420-dependent enzyme
VPTYSQAMDFLERIARARTISLTTFRRDGRPVPTPVWFALDGPHGLVVVTEPGAAKLKRLRNDPRVRLTPCTTRGRVAPDAPTTDGTAQQLDEAGTERAHRLIADRYLTVRLADRWDRLRRRRRPRVGIAVHL